MQVMCVGMALVDVLVQGSRGLPASGTTAFVEAIGMRGGGDALNQALTLGRLGHDVGLMTVLGDDAPGRVVREQVESAGVSPDWISTSSRLPTSTTVVLIGQDGERSFLSQRGASADACAASDFERVDLPDGLEVLSIGSLMCSRGLDLEVLPELLRRARARGVVTIADMVTDRSDGTLGQLRPILEHLDYLVPSELEALSYTGRTDARSAADAIRDYGVGTVVVKRGRAGTLAVTERAVISVGTYSVPVVDTTGSGDNFVAGLISGILDRLPLEDSLRRGAASAGLSVGHLGATSAELTRERLDRLIATQALTISVA